MPVEFEGDFGLEGQARALQNDFGGEFAAHAPIVSVLPGLRRLEF
jgi:hypothetical protein